MENPTQGQADCHYCHPYPPRMSTRPISSLGASSPAQRPAGQAAGQHLSMACQLEGQGGRAIRRREQETEEQCLETSTFLKWWEEMHYRQMWPGPSDSAGTGQDTGSCLGVSVLSPALKLRDLPQPVPPHCA